MRNVAQTPEVPTVNPVVYPVVTLTKALVVSTQALNAGRDT